MQPTPQFVTVPLPSGQTSQEPTALYQLQEAAAQDINDYMQFLTGSNSSQYANPSAYTANLISFAKGLCNYSWSSFTCVGFDPVAMGTEYAQQVFSALQGIILPSTGKSVYDTWISGGGPKVVGSTPSTNNQGAFVPSSVGPIQVPQNPNYIPAGAPGFTPAISYVTPVAVSQKPTGITPTIYQTQAGITSGQLTNVPAGFNVPGIPQPGLLDYVTQSAVSAGTVSDNLSQSQIAAQGGADIQNAPTPASTNVSTSTSGFTFASIGLPSLDTTILGIPIGILGIGAIVAMMMQGGGSGRRGRFN